jgi:hypothetical protein
VFKKNNRENEKFKENGFPRFGFLDREKRKPKFIIDIDVPVSVLYLVSISTFVLYSSPQVIF